MCRLDSGLVKGNGAVKNGLQVRGMGSGTGWRVRSSGRSGRKHAEGKLGGDHEAGSSETRTNVKAAECLEVVLV